jgi:hypothetical protein
MSNHSVIEHRANYHYVKVEEDYIAICLKGKASPHCKALILSILEQWTNTKRDKNEEPIVYMTYPQWIKATYWYHGRNVIIESLQELEDEGFITRKPYRMYGKDTFAYTLNVNAVQERIKQLPEKSPNDTLPSFNLNAFKNKRVPNQTRPKSNGNDVYNQTPDAFNKERNISSNTQLPDIPSEGESNAPASLSAFAERKKITGEHPAITQEMLAEKVIPPALTLPSKQIPSSQSQVGSAPDGAPPASVGIGTAQAGAGGELPALALTAKDIKRQNEKRAKDIWAIIERERQTKYSRTQRELYENNKGIECLLEDQIEDDTIIKALKAMDIYQRKQFTVLKFYGWLPNLTANESPPQNGKQEAPVVIRPANKVRSFNGIAANS